MFLEIMRRIIKETNKLIDFHKTKCKHNEVTLIFFMMPLADFLVVGTKQGMGTGTGIMIGNGVVAEYIVIGAGVNIGIGMGSKVLWGFQLSSTMEYNQSIR